MSVTAVNTQDFKWQADVKFAPDKEGTWKHPAEKDGWMLAHNAIRLELSLFRESLAKLAERKQLHQWEIDCLKVAWEQHTTHVHAHHSNEENELNPFLSTRIQATEKVKDDHVQLLQHLDGLNERISGMSIDKADAIAPIHEAFVSYDEMMRPHLEEEELVNLPLMRAYFTPEEITPIVQKIVGMGPPSEMGSFICAAGEQKFFEFMKQEGIPGFVWYLEFKGKRDKFQKLFVDNLAAVAQGTPPPKGGLFACC